MQVTSLRAPTTLLRPKAYNKLKQIKLQQSSDEVRGVYQPPCHAIRCHRPLPLVSSVLPLSTTATTYPSTCVSFYPLLSLSGPPTPSCPNIPWALEPRRWVTAWVRPTRWRRASRLHRVPSAYPPEPGPCQGYATSPLCHLSTSSRWKRCARHRSSRPVIASRLGTGPTFWCANRL